MSLTPDTLPAPSSSLFRCGVHADWRGEVDGIEGVEVEYCLISSPFHGSPFAPVFEIEGVDVGDEGGNRLLEGSEVLREAFLGLVSEKVAESLAERRSV